MGNINSFAPFVETNTKKHTNLIRKPSPNWNETKSELLITGYWKYIYLQQLQHSKSAAVQIICDVILEYYHESRAKYIYIDGIHNTQHEVNAIIKHKTCFGDIIQIKYECETPFFAVIGDEDLHPCFIIDDGIKYIEIPFEICCKLDNTLNYYSHLMQDDGILRYHIKRWNFIIKHSDDYVHSQFNGYFDADYEPIKVSFNHNQLESFTIALDKNNETIFYNHRWKYTTKDINDFYRMRNKKKHKLIHIEILHRAIEHELDAEQITFPSGKWEYDFKLKYGVMSECFVGPMNEQQAMLRIIHTLYDKNVFESSETQTKRHAHANGYGLCLIISFIANTDTSHDLSRWDLELEDEYKCITITPIKLKEIIIKCPTRTHLYAWKLFYSTECDGLSINTMYDNLCNVQESILIIKDNKHHIFGAFVDCKWLKPLEIKKKNGKIQYRGSIDCFVFKFNEQNKLETYKTSGEQPYFFRNDINGVTIGAGECSAVYFDYSFTFGRSVYCDTYNSPCLASGEQFKIIKIEIWAPNYTL